MTFSSIISKLTDHQSMDEAESREFMRSIIGKAFTDAQIGAMLLALNNKGVSSVELASFVSVLRSSSVSIKPHNDPLIDTCGTGGDSSLTFNISTACAFVISGCGCAVAKHGNKSVSSKCGSADILEALGVNIRLKPEQVKDCIEKTGFGFMFAPLYHPAFKSIAPIRNELGIRTVFNILGPLLNPACVKRQVIGIFDNGIALLYAETLQKLGTKHAMVVHGSGIDEITLSGKSNITELKDGRINSFELNPLDYGFSLCNIDVIRCSSAEESKAAFIDVLNGIDSPKKDIVVLNAAAGLIVGGVAKDFNEGIRMASQSIDSGRAMKKLEEFRVMSNCF